MTNIISGFLIFHVICIFSGFIFQFFLRNSFDLGILENTIDLFLLLFLQGLAKNLEQPEIKDWLISTKDMLMGDKAGKDQEKAAEQLNGTLER